MPKLMPGLFAAAMLMAGLSFASSAYAQTDEATPPGAEEQQDQELPPGVPPEVLPEQTMPGEQELPPDVPPEALPEEQTAPDDQDLPDGQ